MKAAPMLVFYHFMLVEREALHCRARPQNAGVGAGWC